jgi:hypothetical protein
MGRDGVECGWDVHRWHVLFQEREKMKERDWELTPGLSNTLRRAMAQFAV